MTSANGIRRQSLPMLLVVTTLVVAISCTSSPSNKRRDASPAASAPTRLAYLTVDGPANDLNKAVSRLYYVTPGDTPTKIREYPGQGYYEMLASPDGRTISMSGAGPFASWSPDSTIFAYTRVDYASANKGWIETVDVASHRTTTTAKLKAAPLSMPSFSPDGMHFAAVATTDPQHDQKKTIAIADASGDYRVLSGQPSDVLAMPLWSPDGSHIAYWLPNGSATSDGRETPSGVFITGTDGGTPTFIPNASLSCPQAWSADGARLALTCEVTTSGGTGKSNVCVSDLSGGEPTMLTEDGGSFGPAFSPDGAFLAYLTDRDAVTGAFTLKILRLDTRETETVASGVIIGGFSFLAGSE